MSIQYYYLFAMQFKNFHYNEKKLETTISFLSLPESKKLATGEWGMPATFTMIQPAIWT
jgi:hypothetical protein